MIYLDYYSSPAGMIEVKATENLIESVRFVTECNSEKTSGNDLTRYIIQILSEYFNHQPFCLDAEKLLINGTEFRQKVWHELLQIPYGITITYGELAARIGHPKAVRAVGTAVGKNPFCILIPCHRVLPASGKTGQYAYGSEKKAYLLNLESKPEL